MAQESKSGTGTGMRRSIIFTSNGPQIQEYPIDEEKSLTYTDLLVTQTCRRDTA